MFINVSSSNIEALALEGNILKVKFKKGSEYHYDGVSEALFKDLLEAPSIGKAFNQKVKAFPEQYPMHKVS